MAGDAELERLNEAQELAFQRKQAAYEAQQCAWENRSAARNAMNSAYEAKQRAYAAQDSAWQNLRRVHESNGPRIDALNAKQESAYQNMSRSYDAASAAHDRHDGAAAASYAADGHRYKEESQRCVEERRRLIAEIRSAKEQLDAAKPAFQQAKEQFNSCKQAFDSAKAEHDRAQAQFKQAKAEFDKRAKAFKSRLETVKAENAKRHDDKRSLAAKAGVPYQYRDNVRISKDPDGTVNIYFGGVGEPDGSGHGHYVMNADGNVIYKRDPCDPHGAQNFEKVDSRSDLYMRSARRDHEPLGLNEHGGVFYRRSDTKGTILHITQYFADGYHVSWDTTPEGNSNIHWTNQKVPDGHPDRFVPPPDALFM